MIDFVLDTLFLAGLIGVLAVVFHAIYVFLMELYEHSAHSDRTKLNIRGAMKVLLALIALALLYKFLRAHPNLYKDWEPQ